MSPMKKFISFCNDNIVLITGISIIVGVHWTWLKLQDVPSLVDPSEKKELPIFKGAKYLESVVEQKFHELTDPSPKKE